MKRCIGITFVVIVLLFVIDMVCIFTVNRPLFAIQNDGGNVYRGVFYDVYNCAEYSVPQIKRKGLKLACSDVKVNVISVRDTSKDVKDFACAEELESFYEDSNYTYYWSCIKNEYIIVEYENGYKEKVNDALKYGTITIQDLDRYGTFLYKVC